MKITSDVVRWRAGLSLLLGLVLLSPYVHADLLGSFVDNIIPDPITNALQSITVLFYEFLALVLDIFTILLFIIWILLIAGIIYVIYYIVNLPKQLGVNNFQDGIIVVASKLWDFMK